MPPLMVALITLNRVNATSVFLVVGLTYALSGLFYRLPIPVQPLKAVAAIGGGLVLLFLLKNRLLPP